LLQLGGKAHCNLVQSENLELFWLIFCVRYVILIPCRGVGAKKFKFRQNCASVNSENLVFIVSGFSVNSVSVTSDSQMEIDMKYIVNTHIRRGTLQLTYKCSSNNMAAAQWQIQIQVQ
jgi:hypothetical protein